MRTRCPSAASYSRTVVTASDAPNGCSLDTTMLPLCAMAKFRVAHEARGLHLAVWSECENSVVPLARRANPRAQIKSSIATESKSAWKRHDSRCEKMLAGRIKRARKCRDCARAAQADVIPIVRAEI